MRVFPELGGGGTISEVPRIRIVVFREFHIAVPLLMKTTR